MMMSHCSQYNGWGRPVTKRQMMGKALVLYAIVQANLAHAEVPHLDVKRGTFHERDAARLGMSGEISGEVQVDLPETAVGVIIGDLKVKRGFPRLFISGIGPKDFTVCLKLTSADGFYTAEAQVRTSPLARKLGEASVSLPSSNARMAMMMAGQVAALVRVSANNKCSSSSDVLAFSWGSSHGQNPEAPKLLLAGSGNSYLPYIMFDDQDEPRYCTELPADGGSRQSYRWVCEPPKAECRPSGKLLIGWRYQGQSIEGPVIMLRRKCP